MTSTLRIAALGAGAALMLGGCSGTIEELTQEGVERIVEEGIEGTTDAEVDLGLDGDGADLPSSWPASVPEPPGSIIASFGQQEGGSVTIEAASVQEIEDYLSALESAGFERESEASAGISVVSMTDGATMVNVGWVEEGGSVVGTITYVADAPSG
ncbi:hypothetical protein [Demequina activiva]|uniref:Uncharacterized protein n=1 Tax=Demequina activiva TaxID=1582364 RepID=A0A919UFA3_9MICO|nr:hypothetical protein [Demequina activiva]GIG53457.1 hypothetical protein Dac01nite_02090 [Demequina activiva]